MGCEMGKREKAGGLVLCVVLVVLMAEWGGAGSNTRVNLPVPTGHLVERDTSLNALRGVIAARKAVAENLANARTIGYRQNLVRFIDSSTVVVSRDMSQGELVMTNRSLDIGICGRGYIAVTDPRGEILYTRCGTLMLNAEGELTYINGYPLEPAICVPSDYVSIMISGDGG